MRFSVAGAHRPRGLGSLGGLLLGCLAICVLVLGVPHPLPAAVPYGAEGPARIASRLGTSQPPLWISAEELESREGGVDWSALRLPTARRIRDAPEEGCVEFGPVNYELGDTRPYSSRADVRAWAFGLVRGTVVARTPGFYSSMPGTLLSVEIGQAERGPEHWKSGGTVHVFYPRGEFTVGGHLVCVDDPRLPELPAVGDRVFVFPAQRPVDAGTSLVMPYHQEILVERSEASPSVAVPPGWNTREGFRGVVTFDELPGLLRAEERREP